MAERENELIMGVEEFLDMMADDVTIEPWLSQDAYGAPVYGLAKTYRARIQVRPRMITAATGEQVVSTASVILGTADVVSERDRLTLPAEFTKRQPQILQVYTARDENQKHHTTLYT